MKQLAQGFSTAAHDSNPGSRSRESEALPLSHCVLRINTVGRPRLQTTVAVHLMFKPPATPEGEPRNDHHTHTHIHTRTPTVISASRTIWARNQVGDSTQTRSRGSGDNIYLKQQAPTPSPSLPSSAPGRRVGSAPPARIPSPNSQPVISTVSTETGWQAARTKRVYVIAVSCVRVEQHRRLRTTLLFSRVALRI